MPLIAVPEGLPQLGHGLEVIAVEHRGTGCRYFEDLA